jgi:hypothetical protein
LRIEAALRNHQLDNVKITDFPNNSEHTFFVPICCLALSGTSSRWTFHFAEYWYSRVNQLSSPVIMVPNLFAAMLSSNGSNS